MNIKIKPTHTCHKKMVSLHCVFSCVYSRWNICEILIRFSRKWFISICVCMCFIKAVLCENADLHTSLQNNFSLRCIHKCVFKVGLFKKADPYFSQENEVPVVGVHQHLFKVGLSENAHPLTAQIWLLTSVHLHVSLQLGSF